jgi:oxygen-independent coproporphyrinogen-3 oxidase
MWERGMDDAAIISELRDSYMVREDKIRLMLSVAEKERSIVAGGIGKVGLYIGIPFCPTRCLYCSFTAYPLKQYSDRVDRYLDALEREIKFSAGYIKDKEIESIYIGGGTPTSLNERQLERLLRMVSDSFNTACEYTVEAGRPDTITREKLRLLKAMGVGRISINPQTLNDATLRLIGREHTTSDFISAFEMAREEGHRHINTDIILGLPSEGTSEVIKTMEGLKELSPESITVHTLAVKRASRLKETLDSYDMTTAETMDSFIKLTAERTADMGMSPYYMYRQKNMVGNFENVGYCKDGCECKYNVAIMEEKQSVLALGAGGSTKLVNNELNRIERIFNVKSVDDYIGRIEEMLKRKEDGMKWL